MTETIDIPIPQKESLNEQQAEAFDLIYNFILNPTSNQMFCLKGYAGTGKTYLISRVMEAIKQKHPAWDIAMTAPTNKAVQVLRESATVNNAVFKTIHSLLGLKEVIKDSGEIEFTKDWDEDDFSFGSFKIIIIDEVSMLPDQLFFEIKRYNNQVKIIMMGDPAQIPPVGKEDCEPFLKPAEHGIIGYELTKIMRQEDGSAIIENSFKIRNELSRDGFVFVDGKDVEVLQANVERHSIAKIFESLFDKDKPNDENRVIAWTNRKVTEYNNYIRRLLYGDDAPIFMKRERLIMNKPFKVEDKFKTDEFGVTQYDILSTNQEITLIKFYTKSTEVMGLKFKVYNAVVSFTTQTGFRKKGDILILHEDSEVKFNRRLNEIKTQAIRGPMESRKKTWKMYYDLLRSVADVSYAYAITAHKSQGSTYKTAIVDVRNIEMNKNVVERNRILYTSITRAKSRLILIK